MLIDIKMKKKKKKNCSGIRLQWPFLKFTSTLKKFTSTLAFKSILQNGLMYLAEILFRVLIEP